MESKLCILILLGVLVGIQAESSLIKPDETSLDYSNPGWLRALRSGVSECALTAGWEVFENTEKTFFQRLVVFVPVQALRLVRWFVESFYTATFKSIFDIGFGIYTDYVKVDADGFVLLRGLDWAARQILKLVSINIGVGVALETFVDAITCQVKRY